MCREVYVTADVILTEDEIKLKDEYNLAFTCLLKVGTLLKRQGDFNITFEVTYAEIPSEEDKDSFSLHHVIKRVDENSHLTTPSEYLKKGSYLYVYSEPVDDSVEEDFKNIVIEFDNIKSEAKELQGKVSNLLESIEVFNKVPVQYKHKLGNMSSYLRTII